jgi:hypothetical protein
MESRVGPARYTRALLAFVAHLVRTSNLERPLTVDLVSHIADAGRWLVQGGRRGSSKLFEVITAVEVAEREQRITREEAEGILEWLYYTRDVISG